MQNITKCLNRPIDVVHQNYESINFVRCTLILYMVKKKTPTN